MLQLRVFSTQYPLSKYVALKMNEGVVKESVDEETSKKDEVETTEECIINNSIKNVTEFLYKDISSNLRTVSYC